MTWYMDVQFKRKVIFQLVSDLQLEQNGSILLCNADVFVFREVRRQYPGTKIDCLALSDVNEFILSAKDVQGKNYEYILDFGLLEKCQWDSLLIRAMGVNLSEHGRLRYFFTNQEYQSDALKYGMKNHFDVIQRIYENWFAPGFLYGITLDGKAVNVNNWCGNNGGYPFYIGWAGNFDRRASWLQAFYTEDVRWKLSSLLNRIEYDIDVQHSLEMLKVLCRETKIDSVYFNRFLCYVVNDVDKVENLLKQAGVMCG